MLGVMIVLDIILTIAVPWMFFRELEAIRDGKRGELRRVLITLWLLLTVLLCSPIVA